MGNEVAVIRDYDIRDRKLVDATAQSTINSTDAIEMKTTDGNQVFIDKASFIKAVGQAFTASDPKTFTKLLGMNGDGPMGIGASDLASVLGVSDLWDFVLGKYTPIEYLESTGTQWIDTGYIPTGDDIRILTKIMYNGYSTNDQWLSWFSTYVDEQTNTYRIIRNQASDSLVLLYNGAKAGAGGTSFNVSIGSIYEIDFNRNTYNINGTTGTFSTMKGSENPSPLYIFGEGFEGRIYSFSVFKNDVLVLDFIPVRAGQVGYLYDNVSGQLFANQGTGDFVLGPDL